MTGKTILRSDGICRSAVLRHLAFKPIAVGMSRATAVVVKAQPAAGGMQDPLMVRAARGEKVERAPCWMMRQAGRYQKSYRELAKKHPSFRERSETTELIVEISLQPWNSFRPDGVILFSDILTPLPGIGVNFDIDDNKGPIIDTPIRSLEQVKQLHEMDFGKVDFVGRALTQLRAEVNNQAAVLGFVGSPWTLATYLIEGGSTSLYKTIKTMCFSAPDVLDALLTKLADAMAAYIKYQIRAGAQCVQIFDSWGGQLPPREWEKWSGPYLKRIIASVKAEYPTVPLTLYANGSGGLLERLAATGADVVGVDWTTDMSDARRRIDSNVSVQGNVDPAILFASKDAIEDAVRDCLRKAGGNRHILNLGHGVLVGTPEEGVAHMFDLSKRLTYADVAQI
ncbi:uroporphyrinogen decarboxylase chloroplast precursor [Volvox carteri f. nagariensis]|uniref:Uroporphyrinogen decarboxylase n=1 Tax=Volvox carteri f. nagariensis TaxID=3068 RepID=D8UC43_VOLCA|nr:uroporphyrinogen decarboxylase chloroplast precursor [Volvox carteri f. nagariensis]EFJ42779.1 uroporphyrinogen decarboxylase chloroplast precursor [Volvox carteri f. nagariensis]|eukprot:XP_002956240.1 uroporphyrinogen decarboxylase chloroplast precursor [Volvox carteri f. nagariensis]